MTTSTRTTRPRPTLWVGPILFAAVMIAVVGFFNFISGLAAVFSDDVFVTSPQGVLLLDVSGWGWVHMVLGAALVVTGVAVMLGHGWARWVAVGLVSLNMLTQMLLMPAYPFWSLLTIAVDVLVVWALLNHADELPEL